MSYSKMSSGEAFWSVALECALRRSKKQCKANFDDQQCVQCRIYLRKFTQASEPAIQMLMLQADTSAYDDKIRNRWKLLKYAVILAILVGLSIHLWKYTHRFDTPPTAKTSIAQDTNQKIIVALRHVAVDLHNNADVNGDGLTNCIDAAVLFYKYYPEKDNVAIMWNNNPTNKFNHLYNVVRDHEGWRSVEPQTLYTGKASYNMTETWGSQYDIKYNTNATEKYKVYANCF